MPDSSLLTTKQLERKILRFSYKSTVSKIEKGNWKYRLYLAGTGGSKELTKSRFPTKRDALLALYQELLRFEAIPDDSSHSSKNMDDAWSAYIASVDLAFATKERKTRDYKNHIQPTWGTVPLEGITTSAIDEFLEEKQKQLSANGARLLRLLLGDIYQYATQNGLCTENPVASTKPIPDPYAYGDIQVYSPDEIAWMNERFRSTSSFTAYVLALEAGLLPNEIFALRLSDIHFDECSGLGTVSVTKQIVFQNGVWCFTPLPKPYNKREVFLNYGTTEYLKQIISQSDEKRALAAPHQNWVIDKTKEGKETPIHITDFLNIKPDGEMLNPNSIKLLARIAEDEMGIRLNFHFLRYTFALHNAKCGVNPYWLQQQLGIGKFNLVIRFYKLAMEEGQNAISPPSQIFNKNKNKCSQKRLTYR